MARSDGLRTVICTACDDADVCEGYQVSEQSEEIYGARWRLASVGGLNRNASVKTYHVKAPFEPGNDCEIC